MQRLRNKLSKIKNLLKFWGDKKDMSGVADAIRNTQLKQEHLRRRKDMEMLLKMVQEDRLHEADARQLEILRLVRELGGIGLELPAAPAVLPTSVIDEDRLATLVAEKLAASLGSISQSPMGTQVTPLQEDRPALRHVSIDLEQVPEDNIKVSVTDLGESTQSPDSEDPTDKLKRLKILKGLHK